MASLMAAAKPCVKKMQAGQGSLSQIPWQELGMRSLSSLHHLLQLSPGWGAGATWLLAREGVLGERCSTIPSLGESGTNGYREPPQHPHRAQTHHQDCGQELLAACVVLAGGNK